jgi:DNA processing protein
MDIGVVARDDFPSALLEWSGGPACLWFQGDPKLMHRPLLVSVVGTRNPSRDGVLRTKKLAQALVREGAVIVSGMAQGVDYIAHSTTLGLGGKTIAVMGTPIEGCYPKEHENLKATIAEAGLILSQFAPGSPTHRSNFPKRNETMAALAAITIVTEASANSGTRYQVAAAIKLRRPVGFLASLAAQQIPWIEEALRSGFGFVIESPSQIPDALLPFRSIKLDVAGPIQTLLPLTMPPEPERGQMPIRSDLSVHDSPPYEETVVEVNEPVAGKQSEQMDGFVAWVKGILGWVFGGKPKGHK